MLHATIFLADKNDFAVMNKAWYAGRRGSCAGALHLQGGFDEPKYKVEIKIVAAV
ncbi:hypothetical protein ACNKHL_08390 [Shigella flexneri]